jgi:hypothetical protein
MASLVNLTTDCVIPGFYGPALTTSMPSERDFIGRCLNNDTFAAAKGAVEILRYQARLFRDNRSDYVQHLLFNAERIRKLINACRDSRFQL